MIQEVEIEMEPIGEKNNRNIYHAPHLFQIFGGEYDLAEICQLITFILITFAFLAIYIILMSKDKILN